MQERHLKKNQIILHPHKTDCARALFHSSVQNQECYSNRLAISPVCARRHVSSSSIRKKKHGSTNKIQPAALSSGFSMKQTLRHDLGNLKSLIPLKISAVLKLTLVCRTLLVDDPCPLIRTHLLSYFGTKKNYIVTFNRLMEGNF